MAFIEHLTQEARRRIKALGFESKIKVIQCGEGKSGKFCWVYLRPFDTTKPNTQLVRGGRNHRHTETTLLGDAIGILGRLEDNIQEHIQKQRLR